MLCCYTALQNVVMCIEEAARQAMYEPSVGDVLICALFAYVMPGPVGIELPSLCKLVGFREGESCA